MRHTQPQVEHDGPGRLSGRRSSRIDPDRAHDGPTALQGDCPLARTAEQRNPLWSPPAVIGCRATSVWLSTCCIWSSENGGVESVPDP